MSLTVEQRTALNLSTRLSPESCLTSTLPQPQYRVTKFPVWPDLAFAPMMAAVNGFEPAPAWQRQNR